MWWHARRQGMPILLHCAQCGNAFHKEGYCACNRRQHKHGQGATLAPSVGRYLKRQDEDGHAITAEVLHRAHRRTPRPIPSGYMAEHNRRAKSVMEATRGPPVYNQSRGRHSTHRTIQSVSLDRTRTLEINGRTAAGLIFAGYGNKIRNLLCPDLSTSRTYGIWLAEGLLVATDYLAVDDLARLRGNVRRIILNSEDRMVTAIRTEADVRRILSDATNALPVTAQEIAGAT